MLVFVYHNVVQQHIRAWWAFVIPLFSGICKWIYAFGLDLLEGSRFPKGKICFEHQFSYVYKEVIKADFWFKGSGYYNEYPWAQSSSKKSIFTYTKPPTDTIIESCPRNASEEWRNSLCSSKTKYPWALNVTLHYSCSLSPTVLLLPFYLSITVCQLSLSVSFYLDPAANWSCRKKQSKCLFNTKKTVFHIKNKKNKMHTHWPEQTTVPGIVSAVDTWDIINHQGTQTP